MSENNTVLLSGRSFEIREPSTATVLAILNVIGRVGMRAEKLAMGMVSNPSSRAVVFGLLASMTPDDLVKFGIAVLQVGDHDTTTRKFIEEHLRVAPLIDGFLLNIKLSTDLAESLKSFFAGTTILTGMFQNMSLGDQVVAGDPTADQPSTEPAPSS